MNGHDYGRVPVTFEPGYEENRRPGNLDLWLTHGRVERSQFMLVRKEAGESAPRASVHDTFRELRDAWKHSKRFTSSISKAVSDTNYLKIIGLGREVLPSIFEELRSDPDFWFVALESITRENPVQAEHAGDVRAMAEDWLAWEAQTATALACA